MIAKGVNIMLSFRNMDRTNRNDEFILSREKYLKNYLIILTLSGSLVVLLWAWFDVLYFITDIKPLTGLRLGTVAFYFLNLGIALRRKTDKGYRQHLIAGFYLGTIFCAVLAYGTGSYSSNYTYGFLFIIISWLTLIPLSFKKLIAHFFVIIILFNISVMVLSEFDFNLHFMLETNFIYLGVSLVGIAAAFFNNQSAVENFLIKQNIQQTLEQLSHTNSELLQTQRVLTESEQKYRSLIEKSMDGVVISQEGKVLLVNKAFADILGYKLEEMYDGFGPSSIAPEDRERVLEIHNRRMRGEIDIARYSAWFLKKNGDRVMLELNTTTIQIDGNPASLITLRDITEITQIQIALKASEEKYRMLIDRASDGIIITQSGKFKFVNRAFNELMECNEGELIDQLFVEYLVPEDRDRLMEYHKKRMAGDTTQFIYECSAVTKRKKIVHLELNTTYIEYLGSPATFIIMRDLTDRKAIEMELERSRKRYQNLIESIQEGLFVIQDQQFVFLNESIVNLIGYEVSELLNAPFVNVIPPENRELILDRHRRRIAGESIGNDLETELLHKDGKTRIPVILSSNLTEFDGKPAVVGTARDISERIRAEQQIKAAHKKLEEINHNLEETIELRTHELTQANTQLLKLQKENLQSQFDMLKQQVNPHFLFNSLNVLTSLIKLEPDLAETFTEHLSKVYRYVLENKDNETVNLSTELEFLDAYLFLLNIRFMGKLTVDLNVSEAMRLKQIIPLALQLLIENAIKHNAMSKKSPLMIKIFVDRKEYLVVQNNLQERENYIVSTGVGLQNIRHRYLLLNQREPVFEKTNIEFIAKIPLIN
jgi:PAS domain S-box-containing protein